MIFYSILLKANKGEGDSMSYKKIGVRIVLGCEVIVFFGNYLVSNNGLRAIMALQQENKQLLHEIDLIKHDVQKKEDELILWHTYPYYREEAARRQLHMAREKESIYYIS